MTNPWGHSPNGSRVPPREARRGREADSVAEGDWQRKNPFSKTTLGVVIGVAIVSLIVTVVLTVTGDDPSSHHSAGTDGYSTSTIGHRALVELLEKLDVPVVVSRNNSADKAKQGLLVIAEPNTADGTDRLKEMVAKATNVLVVLPKWFGYAQPGSRWIESRNLLLVSDVDEVVAAIGVGASTQTFVHRESSPKTWDVKDDLPSPTVRYAQTIPVDYVEPVISDGARVLLGHFELDGKDIWILTDPDVINNAGLRHPENARLAVSLIDKLRNSGPVVFDETVHGHAQTPSLLRVLFRFPLVLATMQVLICALLVIWAAMIRFGPSRAAPPPLAPGKDFLISNTAALLRYGGHHADALQRYLAVSVQAVRHALHAPDHIGPSALAEWLERVRLLRGGQISLIELERAVQAARSAPQRVVELADLVYRWRMEMIHGSQHRS